MMRVPSTVFPVFCLLAFVQQGFAIGITFDPTSGYLILVVAGIIFAEKSKEDGRKEGRLEAKRKICKRLYDPNLAKDDDFDDDDDDDGEAAILEFRKECLKCVEKMGKEDCEKLDFCEFIDSCCFRKFNNIIIDPDV